MKNLSFFVLCIFFFFSCSENQKSEKDFEQKIHSTVTTYITKTIQGFASEQNEEIILDSIIISKIDTLTDKSILLLKQNVMLQDSESRKQIRDLKLSKIKLESSLGVYDNKVLKEQMKKDVTEMLDEAKKEEIMLDSLLEKINSNPDSTTFRYYLVTAKVIITESDMTEEKMEVPVIVTNNFRVKKIEDL